MVVVANSRMYSVGNFPKSPQKIFTNAGHRYNWTL